MNKLWVTWTADDWAKDKARGKKRRVEMREEADRRNMLVKEVEAERVSFLCIRTASCI